MREIRYVTLDPTGNLTCLVLDPVDPEDRPVLTGKLLTQCEQVAYLAPPAKPEAAGGIRMMGGEFCGNAAMATAAWLVRDELVPGEQKTFLLEVSGTKNPVRCTVRRTAEGYEGTVDMPGIPAIEQKTIEGIPFTLVRLEGIVHLICEGLSLEKGAAEALIRRAAGQLPDEAAGLLQWDRETGRMLPLVYVRGSGSLVWERGCGSGSAAVGAMEALRSGKTKTVIPVSQPGGVITVTAETDTRVVTRISITGQIRIGEERQITIL